MRPLFPRFLTVVLCVLAATQISLLAEDSPIGTNTYGIQSQTAYTAGAYAFIPFSSASTFTGYLGTGARYFTSAGGFFTAPVNLPAGAIIEAIEIQGCDNNATFDIQAVLYSDTASGAASHGLVITNGAPGCAYFQSNLPTPHTVDNDFRNYYIQVTHGAIDGTNRFGAVRLLYKLQVSPAPGTARFDDVPPSHPFFQFIEALAASGITAGCTAPPNPNYCPDAFVTRGQMAVFISRALGLHWAP